MSGNPGGLTVSTSTAGASYPDAVIDQSTTYAITTNGTGKKITGQITSGGAMPTDIYLSAYLLSPPGTTKAYQYLLANSAVDLVTGISTVADGIGNTITYRLAEYASAGTMTSTSKTITLTLCAM